MVAPHPSSARRLDRPLAGGRGQVCVWAGGILWIGSAGSQGSVHAHHAIQLAFGDDRPLGFRRGSDAAWTDYAGSLIPADLPHAIDAAERRFAIIFVDPETAEGRALAARTTPGAITALGAAESRAAADRLYGAWTESSDCARLEPVAREVVRELAGTAALRATTDPRVLGAIELIRARLDGRVTLSDVARELHVSPSRLRHLFVEEVGQPFRTYVLWQRLQRAIRDLSAADRENLTHAALAAGFADAAHMTRTFRRMIGAAPSALLRARRD
ncbi:MAG TPA: AraC family transcriptional regulator [Gemmatimonadales bacterium]|nr:AraC family transcriptional regulator [Gemmatimonadales bacterium]